VLGDRLGRYKVEALIARGGMAEVYRASLVEGAGFERPVCLKMVRPELADDEQFVSMFEREARIAIALRHPNIVQVYDFERSDGRSFLVMELVEGLDLREILRRADDLGLRVPVGFALHAAEGLLAALRHAHGHAVDGEPRPIVHRDVSPHNLLISTCGRIKLADFGIAKARGASNATRTGVVKGKLAYLSPEQAGGGDVGPTSDLFCAGLVLFEMLAGRRLYGGKNEQEVLAQALQPRVPDLAWLSPPLNRFLARLLAAAPEDRPRDASAALADLDPLREDAPYGEADAARLVQALCDPREAKEPGEGPTRTSRSDLSPRSAGARRVAGLAPRIAVALAAAALCAGVGLGWLLNRARVAPSEGVPVAAPADGSPSSPLPGAPAGPLAPPEASPVVALGAEDAGQIAEASPAAAPSAAQKVAKDFGWLQVSCRPWADVSVDRRRVGTTPIAKLRLGAGAHAVTLENGALGYREEIGIEIAAGEIAHIQRAIPRAAP
jgi:eukaryotic-like serine/threonine-protein kinase